MPRSRAITSLVLVLALVVAQRGSFNIDAMVEAGEALVANALILDTGWTADRYNVAAEGIRTSEIAAAGIQAELHGVYGEFPLRGMAELLTNPAVVGSSSVMSNALSFVDIGSGAGRLLLGVAGMLGDEATVTGIEASSALHVIAEKAITELVSQGKLRPGSVSSLLADVIMQPPEPTMARTFAQADVIFCYSTAFPSEDGLRLPELSAALATLLRADSVVITTDKWVVGHRFQFAAHMTLTGEDGEPIQAFIWRVVGAPGVGGFDAAMQEVQVRWMGEDACADNPEACAALVEALDLQDE